MVTLGPTRILTYPRYIRSRRLGVEPANCEDLMSGHVTNSFAPGRVPIAHEALGQFLLLTTRFTMLALDRNKRIVPGRGPRSIISVLVSEERSGVAGRRK